MGTSDRWTGWSGRVTAVRRRTAMLADEPAGHDTRTSHRCAGGAMEKAEQVAQIKLFVSRLSGGA